MHIDQYLGISDLDVQHSELVDLAESLHAQIDPIGHAGLDEAMLQKFRTRLADHFRFEEAFMATIGCDDIPGHAQKHQSLLGRVDECIRLAPDSTLRGAMVQTLRDALLSHMSQDDSAIGVAAQRLILDAQQWTA